MRPERWQQVKGVLQSALELEPSARAPFLDQACDGDEPLRHEVESLLAADESAAPEQKLSLELNQPAFAVAAGANATEVASLSAGRWVGPYKIIEQIGAGGMGEVYRAIRDDDQYRKQVAIKLVRAGQDSALVVSRFKNERQILASLDHPNIARLLDGGTTKEGAAYFVMELIDGHPLDQHCTHHKLAVAERLKLFLQVCSAVQYAHRRLIIHRDIKPGNILVTADGVPKLLDFGIAKLLDVNAEGGQAERTMTIFRVLTPAYASPEQVKGEAITTASDVYSLGVVLYELLTGSSPYRVTSDTPNEMVRAVCEFEPERPSTALRRIAAESKPAEAQEPQASADSVNGAPQKLGKRLSGDLDHIVLMALRKEPDRRYASVEQLAEDIRRHLDNLPVIARKGTARYRAAKFFARHKAGIAATALIVLILLAALVVTLREAGIARQQAEVASQQRARAERRFNDVRKLANSLMFDIHDSIRSLPGATPARKLLVSRALEYLDSLTPEAGGDPTLQRELAAAYERVGDVLGSSDNPNMGDFTGAAQSYAKALTILESLAAANPTDVNLQSGLAGEYFRVTEVLEDQGDFADARAMMMRAQPLIQRMASNHDPQPQTYVAGLYYYTARVLERTGDFSGALEDYRKAVSILEPIAASPQANIYVRAYLPGNYTGIAKMLAETGRLDEAAAMAAKAVDVIKQLSESNPTNATFRSYLANAYSVLADIQRRKGDLAAALKLSRDDHEVERELSAADPNNQQAVLNYGISDLGIGEILVQQGKVSQGLQSFHDALATFRAAPGAKNLWVETVLSESYVDVGLAYATLAERAVSPSEKKVHWREARSWYQKALDVWNEKPNPTSGLDATGHDQAASIALELAKCDAKLR
jgi:serine/threonine protein kinase/tetratricopeptide (TPR) repeat protein